VPRELQPAISVLRGRLAEGMGRSEDALAAYRTAADSWNRPAAAQGRLRETVLRYSLGELTRVQAIAETYRTTDRASNGLFKLKPKERGGAYTASTDEMARITGFLLDCHTPLALTAPRAPAEPQPIPAPTGDGPVVNIRPACRQCKSGHVAVAYGYNYFFRCLDCQGSTPIKESCPDCGARLAVRKSGRQFYLDCRPCGTSAIFFTNPDGEVR